ncbi:lysylphosphatidylglycerol synthase transmembrane domain-containing protein [Desulfovirgula thermocuniculi]|uniref:lysylphosphatidylglycerol synthase transmembrane domain-containing protein n=1 Tax=Desulfovirgula thermocuniculi TaxID=348842 RepID=UPI00040FF615|nr:lysylphosphatidylglycerol synthase transmembrane domain-containing protein [Desulfovirgula thermocuniculi]
MNHLRGPDFAISWSRLVYAVALFLAAGFAATHLGRAREIWQVFRRGTWGWTAVAVLLQLAFLLNQSALYKAAYQMAGLPQGFKKLLMLVTSSAFVSAVIPGGTLSGASVMIYDGLKQGWDFSRVLIANLIFYLFDYLAFLVLLAVALLYLFLRGSLQQYELLATAFLLLLVCGLFLILFFTATRPSTVLSLSGKLSRLAGRLFPPTARKLSDCDKKAEESVWQLSKALKAAAYCRPVLLRAVLHALLMDGISLLQVQAFFLAFGQAPGPGCLIAGYAIGVLFMIVSITPQGVGIVEGAMTTAYISLGVPPEQAVLVTFSYRVLSLWLPVVLGFACMKKVVARW